MSRILLAVAARLWLPQKKSINGEAIVLRRVQRASTMKSTISVGQTKETSRVPGHPVNFKFLMGFYGRRKV